MPNQLVEILRQYQIWFNKQKKLFKNLWENIDKLMTRDDGTTIAPTTFSSWLRQSQLKSGIRHLLPHSLSHTNIIMQLIAVSPIKTIVERAGNANSGIL